MRLVYLFILLLSGIHAGSAQTEESPVYEHQFLVQIGDQAPDFEIVETDGTRYHLSDLRGQVVMLQFTASWCGVCRKEMPHIEKEIWQPGKNKGLAVIGIDRDEPLHKVRRFAEFMKISYPLALDPGGNIFAQYALPQSGITRNVIIDRQGKIIYLTRLFNREEFNKMKQVIFNELNQTP